MTPELWNWIDIAILLLVCGYCLAYYYTRADGDRNLYLWSVFVLIVTAAIRISFASGHITQAEFTAVLRPWVGLIYMLPALHAYSGWKRNRKNGRV